MGLRFRKGINLGKGVKLNISKESVGISAGVKGVRVSVNSKGRKTTSVSIPGTGLSYVSTKKISNRNKENKIKTVSTLTNIQLKRYLTIYRISGYILIASGLLLLPLGIIAIIIGIIFLFIAKECKNKIKAD